MLRPMRRLVPLLAVVLTSALIPAVPARADVQGGSGDFGIGLIIGEPTGISGKLYLQRRHAIDAAIGIGFIDGQGVHVHADYLWHPLVLTQTPTFDLPLYVGVGGRVQSHGTHGSHDAHTAIGPR